MKITEKSWNYGNYRKVTKTIKNGDHPQAKRGVLKHGFVKKCNNGYGNPQNRVLKSPESPKGFKRKEAWRTAPWRGTRCAVLVRVPGQCGTGWWCTRGNGYGHGNGYWGGCTGYGYRALASITVYWPLLPCIWPLLLLFGLIYCYLALFTAIWPYYHCFDHCTTSLTMLTMLTMCPCWNSWNLDDFHDFREFYELFMKYSNIRRGQFSTWPILCN